MEELHNGYVLMLAKISVIYNCKKPQWTRPVRLWLWGDNQCCILNYFAAGFGIPNSDLQTLKSLKIDSSKNKQMTTHAIVQQCFELLWSKISKISPGFPPGLHWEGLTAPPTTSCTMVFLFTVTVKKLAPPWKKLLDTALIFFQGYKLSLHKR